MLDNGKHQLPTSLNTGQEQMKTDHDLPSSGSSTNQNSRKRSLIIKPEAVDGRWSVPGLSKNISDIMGRDPHNGDLYAFITRSGKTAHLLTKTKQGCMTDLKVQRINPIEYWPDKKTDNKGEVVIAIGKEKTDFLKLFCVEALS